MLTVQGIARTVLRGCSGKNMPRQTGHRLAPITQKLINVGNFLSAVIAHLCIADKLQFSIFKIKFVHYINSMRQITANTITDNTKFYIS